MFTCKACNRCGWMWGVIGVTALISTGVLSQTDNGRGHDHSQHMQHEQQHQPSQEEMNRWMKYASPSAHHEKLEPFIGKWNQTVHMWMTPDAPRQSLEGTAEYEWIMGGRFVQGTYEGNFMGQPFQGMDLLGYDNFREQYISIWIDNFGTGFMLAKGWYNQDTDSIIMNGTVDDVMHGFPNRPFRTETEFISDDHIVYRSYTVDRTGKEYKTMEIHSRRASQQSRAGDHPRE